MKKFNFITLVLSFYLPLLSCTTTSSFSGLPEQQQKEKAVKIILEEDSDYQDVQAQLKTINSAIRRTRISLFGQGLTGASNAINRRSSLMNDYNMQENHDIITILQIDKVKLENWLKNREIAIWKYVN